MALTAAGGTGAPRATGGSSIGGTRELENQRTGQQSPERYQAGAAVNDACPSGNIEVSKIPHPSGRGGMTCPEGATMNHSRGTCCQPAGGGGGGIDIGGIIGRGSGGPGGGGGGAPAAGNVERPNLTPIDPQAEYDPEMAKSLAAMRGHESNLERGAGRSMDVLLGTQADQLESQVAQARAAAQAAGIPFDEASFRATAMKGINSAMAQEKLGREAMLGDQYSRTGQMAGAQAGERTQRKELDYKRDVSENELLLDRYGRDIQKYGVDVQAATAANNALMQFYSQLLGGVFGMLGNLGGSSASFSSSNYYG